MHLETLKAVLKQKGYSLTRPRQAIFELLLNKEPQPIKEIIDLANGKVDRATVYRSLDLFEQLGIVRRVNAGWKYKVELSDAFSQHHHHLHCLNCGKIFPFPASSMLETMIDSVAIKESFAPRSHQLEIYGLCPNCRSS